MGRWCLGAPQCTGTEAIRGEIGWSIFKERIGKGKLCFTKKIEKMNDERWAKKIYNACRNKSHWNREIEKWKRREGIETEWPEMRIKEIKTRIEENGHTPRIEKRHGNEEHVEMVQKQGVDRQRGVVAYQGDWAGKLLFKTRSGH